MKDYTVEHAVTTMLRKQLGIPADHEILAEQKLMEDIGADSLDILELVMEIEETFLIEIPDDEFYGKFESITLGDVVAFIKQRTGDA